VPRVCATRGRDDACDGSVINVHGARMPSDDAGDAE